MRTPCCPRLLALAVLFPLSAATAQTATQPVAAAPATQPATAPAMPYTLEHFTREGPIAGVVVKVNLADPRVRVVTALTDDRDPDGDGPAVGRLDTLTSAAQRQDLELAMNASFFKVAQPRTVMGKQVSYFIGNAGWPAGWLHVDGKTLGKPDNDGLRATMIVHNDGRVSLEADVKAMPADARFAVSGNAKMLTQGQITPPAKDDALHPRSAVGLTADGKTLILLAIDGRRPDYSRGTTLAETAALLKEFGAVEGINLDGGGSTTLVVKDPATGVVGIANRPSGRFPLVPTLDSIQRPVVDLVGVDISEK